MADTVKNVALVIEARRYSGWKSIKITRSIEGLAGSFSLAVTDRWGGQNEAWPIDEGDACRVEIDGERVINGFVDKIGIAAAADERSITFSGRDKTADIVDCSVLVPDASTKGNKWTYRNVDISKFAAAIANQHGINVTAQPGLKLKPDPLLVAHPGESGFEAIKRAAASAGVLVVSDGDGGLLITRAGTQRVTSLAEGVNIKSGSIEYDATDRFHRYLITSQPPGSDESSGEQLRVQAEATDADVLRVNRVLVVRPEKGYDHASAKKRADWEARIRAAKSATLMVTVRGWRQPNGKLWPVNAISHVDAPRLFRVKGDMLISQVEYGLDDSGQLTTLHLVRPDAFTPEPQAVVSGEALWKELTPDKVVKK
ncbi:MAG TPA: hypothetical protein VIV58_22855 [Kofleriaceae bacterium]